MNSNMTITCKTCEQDVDCRIGYSNRRIQPLAFSCPHCGSQLGITLDISHAPRSEFNFDGCKPSEKQSSGPFDGVEDQRGNLNNSSQTQIQFKYLNQ